LSPFFFEKKYNMEEELYLSFPDSESWRKWLEENHLMEKRIWMVYYKKHTNKKSITYNEAVEEALCFGWIDSVIKRIDAERYMQKFTPRNPRSGWSDTNILRMRKLIELGKVTAYGMKLISNEILNKVLLPKNSNSPIIIPEFIDNELKLNEVAFRNFLNLSASHQRNYLGWIMAAKKEETRINRMLKAIKMLEKNLKRT